MDLGRGEKINIKNLSYRHIDHISHSAMKYIIIKGLYLCQFEQKRSLTVEWITYYIILSRCLQNCCECEAEKKQHQTHPPYNLGNFKKIDEIVKNAYKCKQLQPLGSLETVLSVQEDVFTERSAGNSSQRTTESVNTPLEATPTGSDFRLGSRKPLLCDPRRQVCVLRLQSFTTSSTFICKLIPKEARLHVSLLPA